MADMDDDDMNEPDDDADDQEGAIPTSDSTDDPESMQDDTGGQTGAAGVTGAQPAPGAAQSPGSAWSQLMALVRAVQSYGMKMAMQAGDNTQQAASFEDGGSTAPEEEDDTTGAIPTAAPETPKTPTEEGFDTREQALDKSGLGGAFRAAQKQKIAQGRADYTAAQGSNTYTAGGEHDFSNTPAPSETQQSQSRGFLPPHQAIADVASRNMDMIKRFLSGDKAVDGNTAAAIGYAVDPNGMLPPVQKKMAMIQYAYQKGMEHTGDPREAMNVALGTLQYQRKEYDMWRTAAAVKMDQQDVGSAIDAANKAFQAPFGQNVQFAPTADGTITATVTDDKGNVQGQFPMQPDQFGMLLHKHGRFDNLVQNGLFDTFSQLSGPMGEPQGPQQPAPQGSQQPAPQGPQQPTQEDRDRERFPILKAPAGVDQKMFDQSRRLFPWVSQNQQREAWIAAQQEQEAGRKSKEGIANTTAAGRLALAQSNQQAAMGRTEARDTAAMDRAKLREGEHNARSDRYWAERSREFMIREAGKGRNDPNSARKTAIVKDALAQHTGDEAGFKAAIEKMGLNYERDILGTGTQQTPATPAQDTVAARAPQGAGTPAAGTGKAPPKVGEVRNGFRFLGGNPGDKAAWERQ